MILKAETYVSPLLTQGEFKEVQLEDVGLVHKRFEKYLSVAFNLSYIKDDNKIVIAKGDVDFFGNDSIPTLVNLYGDDGHITVNLFEYLKEGNKIPEYYTIIDYGYPSYSDIIEYIEGGSLTNPEIRITSEIIQEIFLNCLIINGQTAKEQFTLTYK